MEVIQTHVKNMSLYDLACLLSLLIIIIMQGCKPSFSNTPCIFPLFGRELVNGKLKRRHHAARAVSVKWHTKLREQWPWELGRWVSQARSRRVEEPPLGIFLYNPCSLIATGRLEDVATTPRADIILCPGTRIRAMISPPHGVKSMGSLGLTSGGHEVLTPIEVLAARLPRVDSTTGKKGAGERDSGCTRPNCGQRRCSQHTHGRDGTRSGMLSLRLLRVETEER